MVGWAIAMSARARSASERPRSSAMPHSVTTWSTVFFSVVTTDPSVSCTRMRLRPELVAERRTMNAWPSSEYIAPRAKSAWPPLEDQYRPAIVSDAHWP